MWREALWLVADDVATVAEIDDAIRLGAGLRWSFMGTFLTYRIAGGEAGMRHFMEQFGPALQWPWTKLTDVPELTDELRRQARRAVRRAGRRRTRSASSSGCATTAWSRCSRACARSDYGAGAVLERYERALARRGRRGRRRGARPLPAAARCTRRRCRRSGSTTTATPTRAATCRCSATRPTRSCGCIGIDAAYLERRGSYFTVETHLSHLREASAGDRPRGDHPGARLRREAAARLPLAARAATASWSRPPSR